MQTINTNLLAMTAQRRLNASQGSLARALERLSSGLRVNSAKDDAAGLAVGQTITSEIRTSAQLQRGIGDGVSLVQVAEGGLSSVEAILQRLRELALQSANPSWSDGERAAIQEECIALLDEIDRVADSTSIFGAFPLKGEVVPPPAQLGSVPHLGDRFPASGATGTFTSGIVPLAYIPEGSVNVTISINSFSADDDLQLFTADGRHLAGTPIGGPGADFVWTHNSDGAAITDAAAAKAALLTPAHGFLPSAIYDAGSLTQGPAVYAHPATASRAYRGMTISYTGDGDRSDAGGGFNDGNLANVTRSLESVTIDRATENLIVVAVGGGQFDATATWDALPAADDGTPTPAAEPFSILMQASAGAPPDYRVVEKTPADTAALGVATIDLRSIAGATGAVTAIDQGLGIVAGYRAEYGAHHASFGSAIDHLAAAMENAAASRSRILDADFAAETAALARGRILQDAGSAMLVQANQVPKQVLALIGR